MDEGNVDDLATKRSSPTLHKSRNPVETDRVVPGENCGFESCRKRRRRIVDDTSDDVDGEVTSDDLGEVGDIVDGLCARPDACKGMRASGGEGPGFPILLSPEATLLALGLGWITPINTVIEPLPKKSLILAMDIINRNLVLSVAPSDFSKDVRECTSKVSVPAACEGAPLLLELPSMSPIAVVLLSSGPEVQGLSSEPSPPQHRANIRLDPISESIPHWAGSTSLCHFAVFVDLWRRGFTLGSGTK
jgi:hypothetical protein